MDSSADRSPERAFGAQLRQLRTELGIPADALADTLRTVDGVTLSTAALTLVERGRRPIRLNEAVAIARILDMTLEEMLRPLPSLVEQVRDAEQNLALARSRTAEAVAAYEYARARLERMHVVQPCPGEAPSPPSVSVPVTAPEEIEEGELDGPRLAQGQG